MDGDPKVESELDPFSRVLPLPYRVAIILVCGIWAWGLNLHYLYLVKIDVPALIRYSSRLSPAQRHVAHHHSTYRLATFLTVPLAVSLIFFRTITGASKKAVAEWQILPQSYLVFFAISFIVPIQRMSHNGRSRFVHTFKRVSIGGLAQVQDGKFGDILLADVLTSYAKVLGDLFVSTCMLFSSKTTSTSTPDRGCGGQYLVPLVISIPSIIRLRQCLIEYARVRRNRTPESGWGGQHLANALKYSSAFPVIVLSAIQRNYDPKKFDMSETGLFRLWLVFVFINSFYSFYWDVAKDWDLSLFSSSRERNDPEHPWGLRRNRYFHAKQMYYVAIVIDFFLRCTWSVKLSPHLDHFNDLEGGIFLMEFLEVVRRWMWIFFRVETEWVRNNKGPAPDDILLGEFGPKIDED
ncbi:protein-ER retention protein [Exophiala xenobiotica]|uniref:Protein-ER retention protein n=1 Tax=Lithohypha guttulata TaxID=1690604 RepID=A0ABR0KID4_9EURO|nr:protein-ER retention protein [Lithohypha guttulata]KAK5325206.1 protein-ER retention protein [Exophiala xenobiotica]